MISNDPYQYLPLPWQLGVTRQRQQKLHHELHHCRLTASLLSRLGFTPFSTVTSRTLSSLSFTCYLPAAYYCATVIIVAVCMLVVQYVPVVAGVIKSPRSTLHNLYHRHSQRLSHGSSVSYAGITSRLSRDVADEL